MLKVLSLKLFVLDTMKFIKCKSIKCRFSRVDHRWPIMVLPGGDGDDEAHGVLVHSSLRYIVELVLQAKQPLHLLKTNGSISQYLNFMKLF